MANREELALIRGARSGDAACQLALGRIYLRGSASLPLSLPTALHWLSRAARQGSADACLLIGGAIPYAEAARYRDSVLPAYARATAAGLPQAVRVFARMLLQPPAVADPVQRAQACRALEPLAARGDAEAAALCVQLRHIPAPAKAHPIPEPTPKQPASVTGRDQEPLARAGAAGDSGAQLALGLQLAGMDRSGNRLAGVTVQFKRAIRWLTRAGEQGQADAWFALARIYGNGGCSQRSAAEAQACLERAAHLGHAQAQLECGLQAWRQRRDDAQHDVRALDWLQRAAAQGCAEAHAALSRIAPQPAGAAWAAQLAPRLTREQLASQPLLAARVALAAQFHLSRAEALLLDVQAADRGHCLVVDIRAVYGRSRRRLVPIRTARQRQALDRAVRVFERFDTRMEGNYRQRLYRLKTWLARGEGALLAA
ncbi:hypothetical protein [Pseudoduganella chitinolytica]|uniref:Sel1 repeat family protein n=1 Tax=Pseudoduganella chitinolytica TaxID=34070 RepID=A0ABY8B8X8_9BURK|nr:hypothetical protein [Pseudoduganella chitinolytica]WEF32385.1 hypothetical protein PX653_23690 [Pseudoduganella chitinolytica]